MSEEWQKVGVIGVDSGMCWVGDPGSVIHDETPAATLGKEWHEFCELCEKGGIDGPKRAAQFPFEPGHAGLGVCVSSGQGDGFYDVYVRKAPDGTVAELKVVFDDNGDDETDGDSDRKAALEGLAEFVRKAGGVDVAMKVLEEMKGK